MDCAVSGCVNGPSALSEGKLLDGEAEKVHDDKRCWLAAAQ